MTYKTHRMPLKRLIRFQTATDRRYKHTVSKADPSMIIMTNSEIARILDDLLYIAEHRDKRWF